MTQAFEKSLCAARVGLALWMWMYIRKTDTINFTTKMCKSLGISRKQKYAGLTALEEAGLVRVKRQTGKNPLVTLLPPEDWQMSWSGGVMDRKINFTEDTP